MATLSTLVAIKPTTTQNVFGENVNVLGEPYDPSPRTAIKVTPFKDEWNLNESTVETHNGQEVIVAVVATGMPVQTPSNPVPAPPKTPEDIVEPETVIPQPPAKETPVAIAPTPAPLYDDPTPAAPTPAPIYDDPIVRDPVDGSPAKQDRTTPILIAAAIGLAVFYFLE